LQPDFVGGAFFRVRFCIRNVCAHHSRLWNREMTIRMKVPTNPEWLGMALNAANNQRLYDTLVMLDYMLDIISPRAQWRNHLLVLLGQHPKVDLAAIGFPEDWRESEIWAPRPGVRPRGFE
jgi:abortive infection bacteriophage resistance protein